MYFSVFDLFAIWARALDASKNIKNAMCQAKLILFLLGPAIFILSCSEGEFAPTAARDSVATVALALRMPQNILAPDRAEVVVTGADMAPLRHELKIEGNRLVGTLSGVPAGTRRRFTITVYNSAGSMLATGAAQIDLQAGQILPLALTLATTSTGGRSEIAAPLVEGVEIEMLWIEKGHFSMGSPGEEWGRNVDESPQREVSFAQGFYLGKCELTQGQWEAVMGARPWAGFGEEVIDSPDHPAVYISWEDVQVFLERINAAAGAEVYRLPTEAEWEYAARAGTGTPWSFGAEKKVLEDHVWHVGNTLEGEGNYARAIGLKKANPWGLHDMHGNVWEWVQDWLGDYPAAAEADPRGPSVGTARVFRGGSFKDSIEFTRSAQRCWNPPDKGFGNIGVRLVRIY
ncbi:MAG: hypothetical protein CME16_01895 [Gemmatimonadetes bacterium]|nr:hypothetical protein [Gemmatimonadota bacterium]